MRKFVQLFLFFVGMQSNVRRQGGHTGHRGDIGGFTSRDPYFETQSDPETGLPSRNLTTVEGGKATLTCIIRNLGDNNTVSVLVS